MKSTLRSPVFRSLIIGMTLVALAVGISSIWLLYRTAYQQTLQDSEATAKRLAGLAEAVARFDKKYSAHTHPQGSWGATMSQISDGILLSDASRERGELVIGRLEKNEVVIYTPSPDIGLQETKRLPLDSNLAIPMLRALKGEQGNGELLDYDGIPVLAGFAPIPTLQVGLVYKHDVAEIKAPFLKAALIAALVGICFLLMGTAGFIRIIQPLQKQQEKSEQHLKEAQRLTQTGSWELDLTQNRLSWSDEIFNIFQIDKNKFTASYEAFLDAIHPDDRDMVNQAYTNSLQDRKPYRITHRLLMKDGGIKWVEERCESVFDASGKPLISAGTVQDITRLKQAEEQLAAYQMQLEEMVKTRTEALKEANELNNSMLSASVTSVIAYRASGECVFVNDAATRFVNGSREMMLAQNFRNIPSWKGSGLLQDALQVLATGIPSTREYSLTTTFGRDVWFEGSLSRFTRNGEYHLLMTATDATARKTAEAELISAKEEAERSSMAKSEFLSRMSHELRTPMNAILGFSQVLEMETLSPEQNGFVREIHLAGDHLLELINELLDLSRIEAGKLATIISEVNLNKVLEESLVLVLPLTRQQKITLHNLCRQDIAVYADSTRLKQILVNLLSNAAKYNRSGGDIRIECSPLNESTMRISITDTGPGIPQDKQDRLFQPFERLGAESGPIEGTGIGLALSQKLAGLMGGMLGVKSTPGMGSTFWLDLPIGIKPAPGLTAETAIAMASANRTRVLYIEDNPANLKVIEAMFRRRPNMLLFSAVNGETGLELAHRYLPDVILLDIHLPVMDGFAVLDNLRKSADTRHIPVIALSADAMPVDIEKGFAAGFNDYLTKPVRLNDLLQALEKVMQKISSAKPV